MKNEDLDLEENEKNVDALALLFIGLLGAIAGFVIGFMIGFGLGKLGLMV